MKCPFCGHREFKVTDSRNASEMNAIRRRRECLDCQKRFTTFETVDAAVQVRKRDNKVEDFQIDKLNRGVGAACRHTRVGHEQVLQISSEIAQELLDRGEKEISTTDIGTIVMDRLKRLDTIAYIRFACVYKRFKELDELISAIQSVDETKEEYANAPN